MLCRDRNHPSIVMWSIGNEVTERALPEGAEIARMLADRVRAVDPDPPRHRRHLRVNGVGDTWREHRRVLRGAGPARLQLPRDAATSEDHERFPDRVIIATETFASQAYDYWQGGGGAALRGRRLRLDRARLPGRSRASAATWFEGETPG